MRVRSGSRYERWAANMQNTSRFTKCATVCGSWPRSRRDCASPLEGDHRALSLHLARLPRPQPFRVGQCPLQLVAIAGIGEVVQRDSDTRHLAMNAPGFIAAPV